MRCNVCGSETKLYDILKKHENEVTSTYEYENISFANDVHFYICPTCKHGQINTILDDHYYESYKLINTQNSEEIVKPYPAPLVEHYKKTFKTFETLCTNKNSIMDIGCGSGFLLDMISSFDKQIAIEPSKNLSDLIKVTENRRILNVFFNEKIDIEDGTIDAAICTQVFEHISDLKSFTQVLYNKLSVSGVAYIEVPNGTEIITNAEYYNVYAEHINYFTYSSFIRLFENESFHILSAGETFAGSLLYAYITKKDTSPKLTFSEKTSIQSEMLLNIRNQYDILGIYGCGNKARNIVALMENHEADYIFDSNPMLWGNYLVRSSKKILKPTMELIQKCDAIIITALTYSNEIELLLKNTYLFKGDIIKI